MYEEQLVKYGLSDKQAKVYVSLLKLGTATVNEIAEESDLVRTTTYDVLKTLREEGIVGSMDKNNVQYYEAAEPEKLIQILDERKKYITEILPHLKKLRIEIPEKPRSEIYEGKNGVKTVFEILLHSKKPLYAYSNNSSMVNLLPVFGPNFIKNRVKQKIPIKIISEPSKTTKELLKDKDEQEFRETRTLKEFNRIEINQYFNDDYVAILGSRVDKPLGIIIYHKDFAQSQKIIFDKLWEKAEK